LVPQRAIRKKSLWPSAHRPIALRNLNSFCGFGSLKLSQIEKTVESQTAKPNFSTGMEFQLGHKVLIQKFQKTTASVEFLMDDLFRKKWV
jgi:hypothetical protein